MRIIKHSALVSYWRRNPPARSGLETWYAVVKGRLWSSIVDVRVQFPHADAVRVRSGKTVTVFNIAGNRYRLITAIHYNRELVFTLLVLTHAEYSKGSWKDSL